MRWAGPVAEGQVLEDRPSPAVSLAAGVHDDRGLWATDPMSWLITALRLLAA